MSDTQRPLSEQVAQNAHTHVEEYVQDKLFDLQAPDEGFEPEWLEHVQPNEQMSPHEVRMRQILGGMAYAGLVASPKEYVDMLAELMRGRYG